MKRKSIYSLLISFSVACFAYAQGGGVCTQSQNQAVMYLSAEGTFAFDLDIAQGNAFTISTIEMRFVTQSTETEFSTAYDIIIYQNGTDNLPGAVLQTLAEVPFTEILFNDSGTSRKITLDLATPVTLAENSKYWISVVPNAPGVYPLLDFASAGNISFALYNNDTETWGIPFQGYELYYVVTGTCAGEDIVDAPICSVNAVSPSDDIENVPLGAVVLQWEASSTPNVTYDVYTGTTASALNFYANTANTSISYNPSNQQGMTYFWKVVPKLSSGYTASDCPVWNFTYESVPPPDNDLACNAVELAVPSTSIGGAYTTVGATTETNEITSAVTINQIVGSQVIFSDITNSVWFKFTAPASGSVSISTELFNGGTMDDTQIVLYNIFSFTDCEFAGTILAANDDSSSNTSFLSYIEAIGLTSGEVYYFSVSGYGGQMGTFDIDIQPLGSVSVSGFENSLFSAYPNPVKDILYFNSQAEVSEVLIYNILGQQVLEVNSDTPLNSVNVSDLTAGTYIANIIFSNGKQSTVRIIKK